MNDDDLPEPEDLRKDVMAELARKNYAASHHPKDNGGKFTVWVRSGQTAGGELMAILGWYGYAPAYPKESDSEDFVFKVGCEPANWHNWDEPSYDFIDND